MRINITDENLGQLYFAEMSDDLVELFKRVINDGISFGPTMCFLPGLHHSLKSMGSGCTATPSLVNLVCPLHKTFGERQALSAAFAYLPSMQQDWASASVTPPAQLRYLTIRRALLFHRVARGLLHWKARSCLAGRHSVPCVLFKDA